MASFICPLLVERSRFGLNELLYAGYPWLGMTATKDGPAEGRHGWEHQETRGGAVLAEVEGRFGSTWSWNCE